MIEKQINITKAKLLQYARKNAAKSINRCFYPDCNDVSTNCHIIQDNGILSNIIENKHVYQLDYDIFKGINFKRVGHNQAFSFNCFCNTHDSIFKPIESGFIDFNNYKNLLLFTIRTKLNEKHRKLVTLKQNEILIKNEERAFSNFEIDDFENTINELKLGISDIDMSLTDIWNDYFENSESFIFRVKSIKQLPVVLSSFYTYETDYELDRWEYVCGCPKPNVSDIFVCLFPYKDTSILVLGFRKKNLDTVGKYVSDMFLKEGKDMEIFITNLMLFPCETWAISAKFYENCIKHREKYLIELMKTVPYGRKLLDINIFN